MRKGLRIIGASLALTLTALLGLGCAQVAQLRAAFQTAPLQLEAQGPGTVFASVECAAVDALIYAYRQAQAARDERMRGGTIYSADEGYSYGEILVAAPLTPDLIDYTLKPRDVARFQIYPRVRSRDANRLRARLGHQVNLEQASLADRRSVSFDPLHRPLYILHPSLMIREYRGEAHELVEVANLRRPVRPQRVAGAVPTQGICHGAVLSEADPSSRRALASAGAASASRTAHSESSGSRRARAKAGL